jgi:hypothetical protein
MAATPLPFSARHRARTAIDAAFRKSDLTDAERSLIAEFVENYLKRTDDPTCCPARSEYGLLLAIEATIAPIIIDSQFHRLFLLIDAPRRTQ